MSDSDENKSVPPPACKPKTIKSPDEVWSDIVKYGASTLVLVVSVGVVMFMSRGLNGGGWASKISFFANNVWVRYLLFALVLFVIGSLIGVVNSKVYDSFVMGLGLFVGMTLLGKNTFKAVEKVATQAVSSAVPDA